MQPQEFAPPAALQDTVKCFWYLSRHFGALPASFEVIPDGYAEIIFYFGSPCRILTQGAWQLLPSPCLMGLLNQPVLIQARGQLEIIGIRCFPWTVFELLGLPPGQDGGRLVTHPLAGLQAPLCEQLRAGQLAEALALVTQYFGPGRAQLATDQLLRRAGAAMRAAHGTLPVGQVAAAAHATVRTLERKFKRAAGHTVKDVSALMRFEQVRNRLWQQPAISLAGLAQELGYADQAHLSREFKRFSGTTPAAFARAAKSRQPVAGADFVAFVQA